MSGRHTPPRVIEYDGQRHTLCEWAHIVGVQIKTLRERFARGWTVEEALTTPPGQERPGRPERKMCSGCRYAKKLGGLHICDYAEITGHPRTAYRGMRVDRCPRRRRAAEEDA